jgi:hypothetical protein
MGFMGFLVAFWKAAAKSGALAPNASAQCFCHCFANSTQSSMGFIIAMGFLVAFWKAAMESDILSQIAIMSVLSFLPFISRFMSTRTPSSRIPLAN